MRFVPNDSSSAHAEGWLFFGGYGRKGALLLLKFLAVNYARNWQQKVVLAFFMSQSNLMTYMHRQ